MTHDTKQRSVATNVFMGITGLVQTAFAFLAFWDLAHRPAETVKGPKWVWTPVILINWVGPAAYFLFGQKR